MRLVYPYADTRTTFLATLDRAFADRTNRRSRRADPISANDPAWLFRLARDTALDSTDDPAEFIRRNVAAVAIASRLYVEELPDGQTRDAALTLLAAVAELDPEDQELIRLHNIEALGPTGLAWVLRSTPGDIERRLAALNQRLPHVPIDSEEAS